MKAMILAAGRGERLRPLTDAVPKPLIEAGGKALVAWHLERLAAAGISEVVINVSHLPHAIERALGDGSAFGVRIAYSREPEGALETGGGVHHALELLGDGPFLLLNGDCWTDLDPATLALPGNDLAHLVLVDNPAHNPAGDFAFESGRVRNHGEPMLTYAGIGVLHPALFRDCRPGRFPLAPLLRRAADAGRAGGTHHHGDWFDAGTVERLEALRKHLGGRR